MSAFWWPARGLRGRAFTFASYSAQHGASLLELADALGHKTLKMVQRYSHLSTDSRRRMVSKVFEGRL